jgi:iron complex transport system ATP-binding protein
MIKINELSAGYQDRQVLDRVNLHFEAGIQTAILGPNGAGKSTLLKCISGYLPPVSGEIEIDGKAIGSYNRRELAKKIAIIPQNFQLQFEYQVRELVLMGRYPYLSYLGIYSRNDYHKVDSVLEELDLKEFTGKNFSELSGGEQQRVAIARALVQETPILLLDEAFANLDVNHAIGIMQILNGINLCRNMTIIVVSHNINLAVEYCEQVVMLKEGKVVQKGKPQEVITESILSEVYGQKIKVITNPESGQPNLVYSSGRR